MYRRSAILAVALSLVPALPAVAMPMGGHFTGHVDSQAPQVLGPNEIKVQQTASGTNAGPGTPFDGAQVQWVEILTLKNGQGPVEGTITLTMPGGSVSSAYKGTITTDPQGRVTATGTYRDSAATGAFTGVKGKGNFSVAYSSALDFAGQWQGDVTLPRQKSSRR
ncbi:MULTISPECIES: hypothetical protein [Methylorubrum]|uniref:hypothetical protein n=1 Tax=Methylorubrum TaxID=2282523 RepID=UPI00209EB60D|nr:MULTISPECIES: hypothetical protein [Methylorubrum]MCP1549791.1 hypothetical protein [Methylorubrum zatmanii]MCP1553595.1 hypothetical protein [Methylorubrum extorquens]MCP1580093.1 hypothetical protein [Methylorubrum extorquens]